MAGGDGAARLVGDRGIDARGHLRRVGLRRQRLEFILAEQRLALDVGAQHTAPGGGARAGASARASTDLPVPDSPPTATSTGGAGAMKRRAQSK